jgi:putative flippase GtrA
MIRFIRAQFSQPFLIAKYLVSGLIAATVQVGTLAFLVEVMGFHHRVAVPIAFFVSAIVAFCFQKFWTFRDRSMEHSHFQAALYVTLVAVAFFLNMLFMYIFVDLLDLWYIFAQVVTIGLVTIVTFLCNKNIVFKRGFIVPHVTPKEDIKQQ